MVNITLYKMLVSLLENTMFFFIGYFYLKGIFERKVSSNKKYIISIMLFTTGIVAMMFQDQSYLMNVINGICYMLLSFLLFKGSVLNRVIVIVIYLLFYTLSGLIARIFIIPFIIFPIEELYFHFWAFFAYIIGSNVVLVTALLLSKKILKMTNMPSNPTRLLPMLIYLVPLVSLYICVVLYFLLINMEGGQLVVIVICSTMIFINIIFFVLFKTIKNETEKLINFKNETAHFEFQQKYYEDQIEKAHEARGLWHDMKNHIISMKLLIENKAYGELNQYLLQLDGLLEAVEIQNMSGNPVIDGILNNKLRVAIDKNIDFDYSILVPERIQVGNVDLSIILGNILDNAIEACVRDSKRIDPKSIKLFINHNDNNLLIRVENTVDEETIRQVDGIFISSKNKKISRIGYGISNVNRVLERYHGHMLTEVIDNRFMCTIVLPN